MKCRMDYYLERGFLVCKVSKNDYYIMWNGHVIFSRVESVKKCFELMDNYWEERNENLK